jgi:DNA-binding response OmpR family regulator
MDIRELAAVLMAWVRHVEIAAPIKVENFSGTPSDPNSDSTAETQQAIPWQLKANGRVLACPDGHILPLTGMESRFLKGLATSEGRLLRRQKRCATEGSNHSDTLDLPNIELLVSRLRRKAHDAGITLPLRAIRGCGYLFTERLNIPTVAI